MLAWMVVIFVSILVHELGHALVAKSFGQNPSIRLVAFGGLTIPGPKKIKKWQEFLVILCGPLFGFALFLIAWWVKSLQLFTEPGFMPYMISIFVWVNLFWTLVNLIPIIPLDGGQLMRVVFQGISRKHGEKIALVISMCVCVALGMFLMSYSLFLGILVFFFLFQNVVMFRNAQYKAPSDEKEEIAILYRQGEQKLYKGDKEEATSLFNKVLEEAKSGIIYSLSCQALAKMAFDEKRYDEVYAYLEPIKGQLQGKSLAWLHESAFYLEHFDTVEYLARECYKLANSAVVAIRNAQACSVQGRAKPAIGWLSAALETGQIDSKQALSSHYFDSIRESKAFQSLVQRYSV